METSGQGRRIGRGLGLGGLLLAVLGVVLVVLGWDSNLPVFLAGVAVFAVGVLAGVAGLVVLALRPARVGR